MQVYRLPYSFVSAVGIVFGGYRTGRVVRRWARSVDVELGAVDHSLLLQCAELWARNKPPAECLTYYCKTTQSYYPSYEATRWAGARKALKALRG